MNLENALKIPGWTSEAELRWLAEQASTRRRVVEIGAWMGRSTYAMALHMADDAHLYAVDTWRGTQGEHDTELAGKPEDWLLERFVHYVGLERIEYPHKVRPCRMESTAAADYLGLGSYQMTFDMIFIDAAHDYESVKADILAWRPLLAPGGLLCGHDYDAGRPGVVRAVRELIPNHTAVRVGSLWRML